VTPLDVEGLVLGAKSAAERTIDELRQLSADPAVADDALGEAMAAAQIAVDATARSALNLCGWMFGRWRSTQTRALLAVATARFGPAQQAVKPLDETPL
jgi:hypothetical protein